MSFGHFLSLHQVWRSCLSDGERDYLQQFLPEGIDVEQVVQQLLGGENFHFGNLFLDWLVTAGLSASLE